MELEPAQRQCIAGPSVFDLRGVSGHFSKRALHLLHSQHITVFQKRHNQRKRLHLLVVALLQRLAPLPALQRMPQHIFHIACDFAGQLRVAKAGVTVHNVGAQLRGGVRRVRRVSGGGEAGHVQVACGVQELSELYDAEPARAGLKQLLPVGARPTLNTQIERKVKPALSIPVAHKPSIKSSRLPCNTSKNYLLFLVLFGVLTRQLIAARHALGGPLLSPLLRLRQTLLANVTALHRHLSLLLSHPYTCAYNTTH